MFNTFAMSRSQSNLTGVAQIQSRDGSMSNYRMTTGSGRFSAKRNAMSNGTCSNQGSEGDEIRMMRNSGIIFIVTALLALNCGAQTSANKGAGDPLKTATKPLTPKTPFATGKSWATPPPAVDTRRTNEELTHLERQTLSTTSPVPTSSKTHNSGNPGTASIKPSTAASSTGSGINATYQKPHIPPK
jgi:hypothetical protein